MAGAVGLLVAGRLRRRRAGAVLPESIPEAVPVLEPVTWTPTALPDPEDPPSAGWSLTHEDMAPWEDREAPEAGPQGLPRIRRGPSGREHYWLEP
ncbi:hypothetical protein D7Y27_19150 [Corallococcus sp. AB004]|nr:hypothetical protein D7V77_29025 [Corallococcus sp. CA041A]RKH94351.1 hypothetical protein D7Y04_36990 [Corallococcus sp. AB038B]RKI00932.1 hypothetical protein D7Y15_37030 [Corallococcus sp. AB030]RKI41181.1 hypothetical protein D7Y27_19150 [Corallococcus sp. AB004]RUO93722.1 hypothetical protein D7Y11_07890 [Corallococcus sp. AB018]